MTRWFLPGQVLPCLPIAMYCDETHAPRETWLPATSLSPAQPSVSVGDAATLYQARPVVRDHPAVEHRVLADVLLSSASDLIRAGDRLFHNDLVQLKTDRLPEEYRRGVRAQPDTATLEWPRIPGGAHMLPEAVSLMSATAPNYAHWLTEVLPKAALWGRLGCSPEVPLLVDTGLHPNIMRTLELALPESQRIVLVPRNQVLAIQKLHDVTAPGHIPFEPRQGDCPPRSHGTFSGQALQMMIETVKSSLGLRDSDPQDQVIYIRRNSGARNIINREEMDAFVAQQGWTVVAPERLTFDEQVRVFHGAKMVIGPTGAAMANLLFARPGCRVGVMMSTHPATPYYYWHNMVDSLGVTVEYILCEPDAQDEGAVHCDFSVPVAGMAQAYGHVPRREMV